MSTIKAMQSSQANNAGVSPQTPQRLSRPQNEHSKSVSREDEFMSHPGTGLIVEPPDRATRDHRPFRRRSFRQAKAATGTPRDGD